MNRLTKRPKATLDKPEGRYSRFRLTENPFPTEPVNKDSTDRRINGEIYETEIRTKEYDQIEAAFIKPPQSDLNRLRLGYICDTSYIGRGNGKSAFLINLMRRMNREYCLDISEDVNKCFALYVSPEPGGRTKTFQNLVDLIMQSIVESGILETCLASLRFKAIESIYPEISQELSELEDGKIIELLSSEQWFAQKDIDVGRIQRHFEENDFLRNLPSDFPLRSPYATLFNRLTTVDHLSDHYRNLRKGRDRIDFVFSHLVRLFLAAGFNGAYLLVDDFERIPDFQSERQKKDFAIELRSCLLDGSYQSAIYGFFTMFLVLHAGVPRLVENAWVSSGLDYRYPLAPKTEARHFIAFEKLTEEHVYLLVKKYLAAYRSEKNGDNALLPFAKDALDLIAEMSEKNAAKILRACWEFLEKAVLDDQRTVIDKEFVEAAKRVTTHEEERGSRVIDSPEVTDLYRKATEGP